MSSKRQVKLTGEDVFYSIAIAILTTGFWVINQSVLLPAMTDYINQNEVINYVLHYVLHLLGSESIPSPVMDLLFYWTYMTVPLMLASVALGRIYEYVEQRVSKSRIG